MIIILITPIYGCCFYRCYDDDGGGDSGGVDGDDDDKEDDDEDEIMCDPMPRLNSNRQPVCSQDMVNSSLVGKTLCAGPAPVR